jgi:Tyrosine phosphatase family
LVIASSGRWRRRRPRPSGLGIAEQWGSPPEAILAMLDRVDDEFGGAEGYVRSNGLSDGRRERLRDRLL